MKHLSLYRIVKVALASLFPIFSPVAANYCPFGDGSCIDGLAQVSVSFQFDSIAPTPLLFYYGFDAGPGNPGDAASIKVGYWLQYDRPTLLDFNQHIRGVNWTTEVALRIGNLGGYVGGSNNGCDGVWGNSCSESLKGFLQSSIYNLSATGSPYNMPLESVLQPLTTGSPGPYVQGCPSTLFELDNIPTYAVINASTIGPGNISEAVSVASPGNPWSPWRTWYIPNSNISQQAQQVAVGIIARGPTYGSESLHGPEDIQVELLCARAPKQGHRPPNDPPNGPPTGYPNGYPTGPPTGPPTGSPGGSPFATDTNNVGGNGGNNNPSPQQGYARAIIKTYAFDNEFDNEFEYEEVEDDVNEDEEQDQDEDEDENQDAFDTEDYVECPESSASAIL